jgi:hypothetical protein
MSKKRKKDQQEGEKPAKQKQADDNPVTSTMNVFVKIANFVTGRGRGRYVVSCSAYLEHC